MVTKKPSVIEVRNVFFNIIVTVIVTIKINYKKTKKCKNFK